MRTPFAGDALLAFLAYHLVPGVETAGPGWYARTLDLPHGPGTVRLELPQVDAPGQTAFVRATFALTDVRDTAAAVERARRLVDADCDPIAVDDHFAGDPVIGPLARATPGLRVPGQVDGDEVAFRTVIGQQVSVVGACTVTGRLVAAHGRPVETDIAGLTHLFPDAATIAGLDPAALPMPRARGRALVALGAALAGGDVALDRGPDRDDVRASAPRPARHRALDGRLRRDARARASRRLPAHRRRRAQRADPPGTRTRAGRRRLAALALLRPHAPLEHPDATRRHRRQQGELTCGP